MRPDLIAPGWSYALQLAMLGAILLTLYLNTYLAMRGISSAAVTTIQVRTAARGIPAATKGWGGGSPACCRAGQIGRCSASQPNLVPAQPTNPKACTAFMCSDTPSTALHGAISMALRWLPHRLALCACVCCMHCTRHSVADMPAPPPPHSRPDQRALQPRSSSSAAAVLLPAGEHTECRGRFKSTSCCTIHGSVADPCAICLPRRCCSSSWTAPWP